MGMSSGVVGLRDLDGKFAKMFKVKVACEAAGIPYPTEVDTYFKGEPECDEDDLRRKMVEMDIGEAVTAGRGSSTNSWTVTLAKLPKECIAVVFENSY